MAELDLICGPADPLPESAKTFRLIERLGSGGQADVYKAVRLSSGVSSAPVTVKVFRPAAQVSVERQFRSWEKGDAVLMDLLGRGVAGICRRIDAFYGPPPRRPSAAAATHPVPYQVLEFLPGHDLRQLMPRNDRPRIDATRVLTTIAEVLTALHRPTDDAHPVLHMDIKPTNVIIQPTGEPKVIDFTAARYYSPAHITSIAYTPESSAPEAQTGRIGPSYDVHGFGAIAFYLTTGSHPRGDETQSSDFTNGGLRNNATLANNPRLRDHLVVPLSDNPRERPSTSELPKWIDQLIELVEAASIPDRGVDWPTQNATVKMAASSSAAQQFASPDTVTTQKTRIAEPEITAKVPQQPAPHAEAPTRPNLQTLPTGEIPTTRRLGQNAQNGPRNETHQGAPNGGYPQNNRTSASAAVRPNSAAPVSPSGFGRGVAKPTRPTRQPETTSNAAAAPPVSQQYLEPPKPWFGSNGKLHALSSGGEISLVGLAFMFVCWVIWALANFTSSNLVPHFLYLAMIVIVAVGVFAMARLLGTLLLVRLLRRQRRTARLSHLAASAFLIIAGIETLKGVPFIVDFWSWVT